MAKRPIGITEFVQIVGDADIRMQPLLPSVTGVTLNKRNESRVSFMTDQLKPDDLLRPNGSRVVGLVLWIDKDKFSAAMAKIDAPAATRDGGTRRDEE